MKSVVIIGGGFSGTITAVNLARLSSVPLRITVINKKGSPCRGVAYSTRNASHLLNVAARNMSALADQPNHFVEWLSTRSEYLDEPVATLRDRFVPRRTYGDYLNNLFQWYSSTLARERQMHLEVVQDEALDVVMQNGRATVVLAKGEAITADKVVMAVGNREPVPFRVRGLDPRNPKYIGNPWIGWEESLPSKDHDLLIIGAGLTMVDAFLTLQSIGWQGKIFCVSRNGLLPLSHFKGFDYPNLLEDNMPAMTLRKMFALFKQHYRTTRERNLNPAILVDKLRPFTQRLWQNFSLFEKRQFNRHFRTRWNVVRHRIAPEIHNQLHQAIAAGKVEIIKGRLCECAETNDKLNICVESGGAKRTVHVGAVINCTGPQENYLPAETGLFHNLFARCLIQPDEMNMGLKAAANFAVIDRAGQESDTLFAVGSLLKGTLWETTAVPELRSQTFRIAEILAAQMAENAAEKSDIAEVVEDVMEYAI
jgi:uncharacterized NAD(P)/FAD-binding protein YdhS